LEARPATVELMILERGALLNNRYRIVEILGQGGMGSVYRAVDENLGVEVAVKDNLFTTEEYARQFHREAIILANLRHPNLPRVTDHFIIENQGQYLVMDYIEGEDLRQRMDRIGLLSDEEVILIGSAICDALEYLSTRNPPVIHRDIKPGNVKISPHGQIFLVDFGLAKVLMDSQSTTTGARAMTPGYSPPEQYGTARTDHRSDIFSLGATLYAALTGSIPEDALARAMDQADLTPVRRLNQRVSRRLATVIEKSLSVYPDERYQSAEEFKQALWSALPNNRRKNGEIIVPPPPMVEDGPLDGDGLPEPASAPELLPRAPNRSPLPRPISTPSGQGIESQRPKTRPRRRRRTNWGCILVFVFVGLILVAGSLLMYDPSLMYQVRAWIAPPVPVQPSATSTLTPAPTLTVTPDLPTPTIRPLVKLSTTPSPLPSLSPTPTPSQTPLPTPTFTPLPTDIGGGSGQIAFASDFDGTPQIYTVNLDGSGLQKLTSMVEGACQPVWSPDGMRLAFISPCLANQDQYPDSTIYLINRDGKGLTPLLTGGLGNFDPAWSPDGSQIAYTSLSNVKRPRVFLYTFADKSVKRLSDTYSRDKQPAWSPDGKQIAFVTDRKGISQIWIMDQDGTNQKQFSYSTQYDSHPDWSPDGKWILFTQMQTPAGIPRVVVVPYGVSIQDYKEYPLGQDRVPMRDARYSPDGYWIAAEAWPDLGHKVYIMSSSGAGRTSLNTNSRGDFDPDWEPIPR
jgi:serine/threonine protein kinase